MSKQPITIDVDRYICAELSDMRDMIKVLDFSSLGASIERVQRHATAMEDALWAQKDFIDSIRKILENKELPDGEVLQKLDALLKKYDEKKGK